MEPVSIIDGARLENAAADLRSSRRVEQYRIGKEAIYLPGFPRRKYLPLASVRSAAPSHRNIRAGKCVTVDERRPVLLLQTDCGAFRLELEHEKSAALLLREIEAYLNAK